MVARALRTGNSKQQNDIRIALGNRAASDQQFEAFRAAIEASGALDYCKRKVEVLVAESITCLDDFPASWQAREEWQFLHYLAQYVQHRSM